MKHDRIAYGIAFYTLLKHIKNDVDTFLGILMYYVEEYGSPDRKSKVYCVRQLHKPNCKVI